MEMPMLDEEEFLRLGEAHVPGETLEQRFAPVLREYARITGYQATNPIALYHHRLSLYGPPCSNCGKPLRSPKANCVGRAWLRSQFVFHESGNLMVMSSMQRYVVMFGKRYANNQDNVPHRFVPLDDTVVTFLLDRLTLWQRRNDLSVFVFVKRPYCFCLYAAL
jgi:hypothetical protein